MSENKLCLVVPCYNEERRLAVEKYEKYLIAHPDVTFCFVNDGSTDQTGSILEKIKKSHPNAILLDLPQNGGKAEAVRRGVNHVSSKNFAYIGFWDADLATPLGAIGEFQEKLTGNYDLVMGSRIQRLGANINRKWYRHYLGRLFATVASFMLSLPVYDTQCGAKIFSREICKKIFDRPFISYWLFDVELLFRMKLLKSFDQDRLYELPLSEWEDVNGSKLKLWDFLQAPLELFKMYFRYKR